jgi:hypothetical protein
MTTRTKHTKYPTCELTQRIQDVFLVSSFTLWAMLLGLGLILTYHALIG